MIVHFYLNRIRIESLYSQIKGYVLKEMQVKDDHTKKTKCSGLVGGSLAKFPFLGGIEGKINGKIEWLTNKGFVAKIIHDFEQKLNVIKQDTDFSDIKLIDKTKELFIGNSIKIESDFYSKDLRSPEFYKSNKWDGSLPYLYTKIRNKLIETVKVVYSPEHMTTMSSWVHLSGHKRLCIYGFIAGMERKDIIIAPISIGLPEPETLMHLFG